MVTLSELFEQLAGCQKIEKYRNIRKRHYQSNQPKKNFRKTFRWQFQTAFLFLKSLLFSFSPLGLKSEIFGTARHPTFSESYIKLTKKNSSETSHWGGCFHRGTEFVNLWLLFSNLPKVSLYYSFIFCSADCRDRRYYLISIKFVGFNFEIGCNLLTFFGKKVFVHGISQCQNCRNFYHKEHFTPIICRTNILFVGEPVNVVIGIFKAHNDDSSQKNSDFIELQFWLPVK